MLLLLLLFRLLLLMFLLILILPLKFGQNWVSNSLDIADIEFVRVVGGWWCKVIFFKNPTCELWLSWGCDNLSLVV